MLTRQPAIVILQLALIAANQFCFADEVVSVAAAAAATASAGSAAASLGKKWILYHSIGPSVGGDDPQWVRRGTVDLNVNVDGNSEDQVKLTVENDEGCLSETAIQSLMESKWYRLKLEEESTDGGRPLSVMTTVSSCQVRRSNFR
jgi:hypothetical protein